MTDPMPLWWFLIQFIAVIGTSVFLGYNLKEMVILLKETEEPRDSAAPKQEDTPGASCPGVSVHTDGPTL